MDERTGPGEIRGLVFSYTVTAKPEVGSHLSCFRSPPLYNLLFLKIIKAEKVLRNHIIQDWETNIAHRPIPLSRADITNLSQHFFLLSLDGALEFSVSLQLAGIGNGHDVYYLN